MNNITLPDLEREFEVKVATVRGTDHEWFVTNVAVGDHIVTDGRIHFRGGNASLQEEDVEGGGVRVSCFTYLVVMRWDRIDEIIVDPSRISPEGLARILAELIAA